MVLSMSSRQLWLWQSLILSSQFEKSENKREREERERWKESKVRDQRKTEGKGDVKSENREGGEKKHC